MTDYHKSLQNQTTPDPITTAHGWTDEVRQAVTALEDKYGIELISGPHHAKWVDAACYEIGGGSIRMYKDDVEKLKAERDEAVFERDFFKTNLELADNHAKEVLRPKITRLTSQLEQAEKVIAPFAETAIWAESNGHDIADFDMLLRGPGDTICGHLQAQQEDFAGASQWIKDRQAKTDGEAS